MWVRGLAERRCKRSVIVWVGVCFVRLAMTGGGRGGEREGERKKKICLNRQQHKNDLSHQIIVVAIL